MVNTSDLTPTTSGSASIGVNQINGQGFVPGSIKPYAHVHMNSGVWHDQSGQSGVLRYNRAAGGFEVSINGGATFSLVASTTPINLDDAYEVGNEINQNRRTLSPTSLSEGGMVIGQVPVIIKHAIPGAGNTNGARSLTQGREDAGVVASGFSLTPNLPNTFAYGVLGPGFLHLQASGTQSTAPVSFVIGLGNVGSILDNLGIFSTDAAMQWNVRGLSISTDAGEADGDIVINTGNVLNGLGGQVELNAFASSGRLQFRFGPHQAWHAKLSHSSVGGPANDGFWPIPHSGQIAQMITLGTDLQLAYNNGNEIDHRKDLIGYKGVVIRETIPGLVPSPTSNADITANKPGKYGIAVSGFTLTPTTNNSFSFAALTSNSLMIASSGSVSALSRSFFLGYASNDPNTVFFNSDGTLRFLVGDQTGAGTGGQILLDAFAASGRMQFRFGPRQGWAVKLTHSSTGGPANDGFWPLPHSGQILEMVQRPLSSHEEVVFTNNGILASEKEFKYFSATDELAISGAIRLKQRSAPMTDLIASGITRIYSLPVARREYLQIVGSGLDPTRLQPSLEDRLVFMVTTNTTTSVNVIGNSVTSVGTLSHPAATQTLGFMTNFATGAVATNTGGTGSADLLFFRGNARGINTGFYYFLRVALPDATYDRTRIFCGLTNQTMVVAANADNPAGNHCGFQFSNTRGDVNWQFMTKDATTQRLQNTGVHCSGSRVYDMSIYCPPWPNNDNIYWQINDITTPAAGSGVAVGNLPLVNTALRSGFQIDNITATARNIRMQKLYTEGLATS